MLKRSWLILLAAISVVVASPAAGQTSSGSGIAIGAHGEILTNAHVIEGCGTVTTRLADKLEPAAVVATDQKNDLAVIRTKVPIGGAAAFREGTSVRSGDTIVAMGYPLSGLLATSANVSVGTVSALAGLNDDSRYLQISAPIQPGNSGGPLLDASGHLVGIVTAKLDAVRMARFTGDVPQNVNFAIKADVAKTFLDSRNITYQGARSDQQLSAADIADIGRPFTVHVECARSTPAAVSVSPAQTPSPGRKGSPPARSAPGTFATIRGVFVRLPTPVGFCDLSESNPFDQRIISIVAQMNAKSNNKLLSIAADCRQLSELRTGKRQLFDDYVQYATSNKTDSEPVARTCAELREKGEQTVAGQLPDMKARMESIFNGITINEASFIGVLAEDANACYGGLIKKFRTDGGADATQITVFAVTSVKNRPLFSYRIAAYQNPQTIDEALRKIKSDIAALLAANK